MGLRGNGVVIYPSLSDMDTTKGESPGSGGAGWSEFMSYDGSSIYFYSLLDCAFGPYKNLLLHVRNATPT